MNFHGQTYQPEHDETRLTSQLERVKELMNDGEWRTLQQIANAVQGSEAGISARLRDLRNKLGLTVTKKRIGNPSSGLWAYQVQVIQPFEFEESGQGVFI